MDTTACTVRHVHPCDTVLPMHVIVETLETHDVETTTGDDDVVWAWEPATLVTYRDGVRTAQDASEWVLAPTTAHDLAAWLGY